MDAERSQSQMSVHRDSFSSERRMLLWFLVVIAPPPLPLRRLGSAPTRAFSRGREGGAAHYGDGWEGYIIFSKFLLPGESSKFLLKFPEI